MNIARMEKFEQLWSVRHDLPAESLAQYRFESREGYRLPELAAHYRTYVETLESIVIRLPEPDYSYENFGNLLAKDDVIKMIADAELRIAP